MQVRKTTVTPVTLSRQEEWRLLSAVKFIPIPKAKFSLTKEKSFSN